jgi:arsenate reductase
MYSQIEALLHQLEKSFDEIPLERRQLLDKLSAYINEQVVLNASVNLVYICTHNSRRSHFGQLAAAISASYYGFKNVYCFSGGTEATAFNHNAINALKNLGFVIQTKDDSIANPLYHVAYSEHEFEVCFSKTYDHDCNPKQNFAAIMTCSDAEQNCPFIPGAVIRIGTTYKDPKEADDTDDPIKVYMERFKQIATETLYVFSQVKNK